MSPRNRPGSRVRLQRTVRLGGVELPLESGVLDDVEREERAAYLRRRAELAPLPPVAERSTMSETAWRRQLEAVAKRLHWYCYHPKLSRWSARGWPDLSFLGSRALWVECKDDDGVLTEAQVEVIDRMLACGLEVHVLRPWHGLDRFAEILRG